MDGGVGEDVLFYSYSPFAITMSDKVDLRKNLTEIKSSKPGDNVNISKEHFMGT